MDGQSELLELEVLFMNHSLQGPRSLVESGNHLQMVHGACSADLKNAALLSFEEEMRISLEEFVGKGNL